MSTRYIYVELISQQHGMTMNYTHTHTDLHSYMRTVCVVAYLYVYGSAMVMTAIWRITIRRPTKCH